MSARRPQDDLRVLRELARETAELPVPPIDWERIEAQLSRADVGDASHGVTEPRRQQRAWARAAVWVGPVALAASIAVAWWTQWGDRRTPLPSSRVIVPTLHDADGWTVSSPLQAGDIVASGAERFHYQVPGVASFSLAKGTTVEVVAVETSAPQSLTVALRSGAIHADVIHREHGEAFGVEVGSLRVAVHGTSFSVVREGDRALVDVKHGAVAVGPVGRRGSTEGWLMVGPDRASFALDGANDVRWLAPEAEARVAPAAGAGAPLPLPSAAARQRSQTGQAPRAFAVREPAPVAASSTATPAATIEPPSRPALERGAAQAAETAVILQKIAACHANQASSGAVRFSVDTTLTLSVYPSGIVRQGLFEPPLSPTLMRCASDAIREARFAPGSESTDIRLPVHLPPN